MAQELREWTLTLESPTPARASGSGTIYALGQGQADSVIYAAAHTAAAAAARREHLIQPHAAKGRPTLPWRRPARREYGFRAAYEHLRPEDTLRMHANRTIFRIAQRSASAELVDSTSLSVDGHAAISIRFTDAGAQGTVEHTLVLVDRGPQAQPRILVCATVALPAQAAAARLELALRLEEVLAADANGHPSTQRSEPPSAGAVESAHDVDGPPTVRNTRPHGDTRELDLEL
jgi:hypothetical protein